MPLISVIIPIYKVEEYLHKCVDSVIGQNFKDIEIILVDDGSPDNCPAICDEFEKKDSRIKVIHKDNGGSSDARNFGIDAATGEYIMFLDSDDYWEGEDCLSNIIKKLQEKRFDVLIYSCQDYNCFTGKKTISRIGYNNEILEVKSRSEILDYLFSTGLFPGSAWVTVTKRDFVINNNIFFIKGIKGEDYDWLLNVFLNAKSFSSVNDKFYIYLKYRNDSITGTSDLKSIEGLIATIEKWAKILNNEKDIVAKNSALNYLAYILSSTFITASGLNKNDKEKAFELIKRNLYIFDFAKTMKTKLVKMLISSIGLNLTAYICWKYYTLMKKG